MSGRIDRRDMFYSINLTGEFMKKDIILWDLVTNWDNVWNVICGKSHRQEVSSIYSEEKMNINCDHTNTKHESLHNTSNVFEILKFEPPYSLGAGIAFRKKIKKSRAWLARDAMYPLGYSEPLFHYIDHNFAGSSVIWFLISPFSSARRAGENGINLEKLKKFSVFTPTSISCQSRVI